MSIDPVVLWASCGIATLLGGATLTVAVLSRRGRITAENRTELYQRIRTWALLTPLLLAPILLGPFALKIGAGVLGILCFREYNRATGLFRERIVSSLVYLCIVALTIASLAGLDGLWVGAGPLGSLLIVAGGVFSDRPAGYLQRVALGVLGFLLFGVCLGHLGLLAERLPNGRVLLWLLLCVTLNDVAAYLGGKLWGRRKLCPHTSPNKTRAGAWSAIIFTSVLSAAVGLSLSLPLASIPLLLFAGALCSTCGTIGDLIISSVKRDLGIKDMSAALPGHGGILDRFDSLLLAVPCLYYFISWTINYYPTAERALALTP